MGASRTIPRVVTVSLIIAVSLLFAGSPAGAHNILVSARPATGSAIDRSPESVSVTFDDPVQNGFTELIVLGPGNTHWEAGPPVIEGNTVRAPLRPLGPAARYTIEYRVVSADGHPVSGESAFTLTVAGTGTPAGPGSYSGGAPPAPVKNAAAPGGLPIWPWLVGGGVMLALGFGIARRLVNRG